MLPDDPVRTQLGKYPALLGLPNPETLQQLADWGRALQKWFRRKEQLLHHSQIGRDVLSAPSVDIDLESAWHHLRQIAGGRSVPPKPALPLSITDAVDALDALVNWAADAAVPADSPATIAEQTSPAARAIALMLEAQRDGRPIPQVQELARLVDCHRSTLSRDPQFTSIRQSLLTGSGVPRGRRTDAGDIEAEAD
jgi:hypothetical protein